MKMHFLLIALFTVMLSQSLQAIKVENDKKSQGPIHVRIFPSKVSYESWQQGRGVADFFNTVLGYGATLGEKEQDGSVEFLKVKFDYGKALRALGSGVKQLKDLLSETAAKRVVDEAYQLKYAHLEKGKDVKGDFKRPTVYVVVLTHPQDNNPTMPLAEGMYMERDILNVKLKKGGTKKDPVYEAEINQTGSQKVPGT